MSVKKSHEVEAKNVAAGKDTTIQVLISSQEGPNFALRKFSMKPGGGMPLHTNTVEHEQYVLGGRAKIGIGEQVFEVQSRETWCLSPKVFPIFTTILVTNRSSSCASSQIRKIRSRL